MLTEIYIEALQIDEEQADWVWEAWGAGEVDNLTALMLWWVLAQEFADLPSKKFCHPKQYRVARARKAELT